MSVLSQDRDFSYFNDLQWFRNIFPLVEPEILYFTDRLFTGSMCFFDKTVVSFSNEWLTQSKRTSPVLHSIDRNLADHNL